MALGRIVLFGQRDTLRTSRVRQAKLVGAGGPDEVVERGELGLPAEPAEPAVGQSGDAASDLRVLGVAQADEPGDLGVAPLLERARHPRARRREGHHRRGPGCFAG